PDQGSSREPYLLYLEDITRNDLRGLNFSQTSIAQHNGLEREGLLQFIYDRTSLKLLDKANASVEQEQGADDTKINPILKTSREDSSSLTQSVSPSASIVCASGKASPLRFIFT